MWLNILAVKNYHIFSCLYGRLKIYGNFHPNNKVNISILLEMNCKINILWGAKIPSSVH